MRRDRLIELDELGYPKWMELPVEFWPDEELSDWLWENEII